MSLEGVTFAVARRLATVPELRVVYASTPAGAAEEERVQPYGGDIADTPAAFVSHARFTLEPGSWERITHYILIELYLSAANADQGERERLALVTAILAAFRTDIDLYGTCTFAVITSGGEDAPEDVNGKPMTVYPMIVRALEATAQTYTI